jgi:hypothetical protein
MAYAVLAILAILTTAETRKVALDSDLGAAILKTSAAAGILTSRELRNLRRRAPVSPSKGKRQARCSNDL